jgi:hypothetical protein
MQGWLPLGHGGSECFAIQGHDITRDLFPNAPDPGQEGFAEGTRVQHLEDPPESVMGGNAIREIQEGPEPGFLVVAKLLNALPLVNPGHRGQNRNHHDVEQKMALTSHLARIRQSRDVVGKTLGLGRHGRNSMVSHATLLPKVQTLIANWLDLLHLLREGARFY